MRQTLAASINSAITALLIIIVAVTPLFFLPLFTEFFEIPKTVFLIATTLVLFVLWTFTWVLEGKVKFVKTPLDLPLLLLLVAVILSTFFAESRYLSIFGNFSIVPRLHGSAATLVTYIILYFIATSHIRSQAQVKALLYMLIASATIVAVVSLLSYFGVYLPIPFAQHNAFTPTGSSFSTTAILALLLPLLLVSLVQPNRFVPMPVAIALSTLFGITIALTGTMATQIAALVVLGLVVFVTRQGDLRSSGILLAIPAVISLIIFAFGYVPTPNNSNPLQVKRLTFLRELQLPADTSWKIAAGAFGDKPFFGTGPSTFLNDFTNYKPVEFNNNTKLWSFRFDSSFNEYFQILATLGGLGLLALVFLSVMIVGFGWSGLASHDNYLAKSLSIAALAIVVLLLLHATTLVLFVVIVMILAMLAAIHKGPNGKVEELSLGIKASKLTDSNLIVGDILPIIIFIPAVILSIIASWHVGTTTLADYHHRKALNSANQNAVQTYQDLVAAERFNPYIDLYRTDLAKTNFAIANALAAAKGPTEASPSGSLTDDDKRRIQQLLSQSIDEGRVAVLLNPKSAENWATLGSIYRQISGVAQNALNFSLDAYGRAIQNDPFNPILRLNVGGIYYSVKNYDLAIRFFSDAVNLKPDYANAYYNLSIALRDKGDLQTAQAAAERVVALLQTDTNSADYKVASEYLTDLKARIATGSANQSAVTPPAAQTNSALNNPQDVDLDLGNTPQVATPAAVSPNPSARVSASPSPTPSASPAQ